MMGPDRVYGALLPRACVLHWSVLLLAVGGCRGEVETGGREEPPPELQPGMVRLSVVRSGTGAGMVTSTPAGIECGSRCEAHFPQGASVRLQAAAADGSLFAGWSGACSGTQDCELQLGTSLSVGARFDLLPAKVRLTVERTGPGTARIVSEPAGIDCGTTCSAEFVGGTHVRLRLLSDASHYLVGWSGACSGVGPCQIVLHQDSRVSAQFHPRLCPAAHFCWDNPYPQGSNLTAMVAFSPTDIWAIGAGGVLLRYNGIGWLSYHTGLNDNLFALWGTDANNLWAAGEQGTIYQWNGSRWTTTLSRSGDIYYAGLWGTGTNNVWAVGYRGQIRRWNGTSWSAFSSGTSWELQGIWGFGPNDIWAVGGQGVIRRFNGTSWNAVTSPTTQTLYSVWGAEPNDVWAVGANGTVLRWNGTSWALVNIGSSDELTQVYGTAKDNVWIVTGTGTAWHFDGTRWKSFAVSGMRLNAIRGSSASDLWAVGGAGTIARFDGTRWTLPYGSPLRDLRAALGLREDDIWAVGALGTVARFDGYLWRSVSSGVTADLNAIWASGPNDIWIVGEAGTVLRYDGTAFRSVPGAPRTANLKAISGSGPDDVWIVGSEGILHWNGSTLSAFDPMLRLPLSHVLAVGRGSMWAGEGLLVHVKDGQRSLRNVPAVVTGIWGSGPNDVWVGYENGSFQRYDGTSWGLMQSVLLLKVARYWASGPRDVWALGEGGRHARWDGTTSYLYDGGFRTSYAAVWGTGPAATWLFGLNGTVTRFKQ